MSKVLLLFYSSNVLLYFSTLKNFLFLNLEFIELSSHSDLPADLVAPINESVRNSKEMDSPSKFCGATAN